MRIRCLCIRARSSTAERAESSAVHNVVVVLGVGRRPVRAINAAARLRAHYVRRPCSIGTTELGARREAQFPLWQRHSLVTASDARIGNGANVTAGCASPQAVFG